MTLKTDYGRGRARACAGRRRPRVPRGGPSRGTQIRGTAPPEATNPVEEAALEFWDEQLALMVEFYDISPEDMRRGHYSDDPYVQRSVASIVRARAALDYPRDPLHSAPREFKNFWGKYLDAAQGRYAVLFG